MPQNKEEKRKRGGKGSSIKIPLRPSLSPAGEQNLNRSAPRVLNMLLLMKFKCSDLDEETHILKVYFMAGSSSSMIHLVLLGQKGTHAHSLCGQIPNGKTAG